MELPVGVGCVVWWAVWGLLPFLAGLPLRSFPLLPPLPPPPPPFPPMSNPVQSIPWVTDATVVGSAAESFTNPITPEVPVDAMDDSNGNVPEDLDTSASEVKPLLTDN